MRAASMTASKQSAGPEAARTGTGASPLRPQIAWSRSACSVFVGNPVDGPPRWMLITSSGSSAVRPRLIVSCINATPGPEVVVTPRFPPNDAPSAAPTAAISSSAWNVITLKFLCLESSCSTSLAGVIGYVPRKTVSPDSSLTATIPSAVASLPETLR
jgi:hypothetical protein